MGFKKLFTFTHIANKHYWSYSCTISMALSWPTNSHTQVRPLNLESSIRAIMLCALSCWKIQANSRNQAKTFTNLVAMWLYKVSNSKSQFPHYNKGSTITLWSTLAWNFTLIIKGACKTSNKNQTPRVWFIIVSPLD